MSFAKTSIISILASTLVIGCSNPKDANEGNFTQAVKEILPQTSHNCFGVGRLPYTARRNTNSNMHEELVKAGLLSKSSETKEYFGRKYISAYYYVSPEGKKIHKQKISRFGLGTVDYFCVGEMEVDKIVNFTEPQNQSGIMVSHVKYSYKLKNIPKWARNPQLQQLIPSFPNLDKPSEASITLKLTNKGWMPYL